MKKRLVWVGATALALIFGTAVYASGSNDSGFGQMPPHMKQMHPNMTDAQVEQMVQHCHGADRQSVRSQGMMRGGMMHNQMMQNGHGY